jgi:hypothetical protein
MCHYKAGFLCGLSPKVIAALPKWLVRLPVSRNVEIGLGSNPATNTSII